MEDIADGRIGVVQRAVSHRLRGRPNQSQALHQLHAGSYLATTHRFARLREGSPPVCVPVMRKGRLPRGPGKGATRPIRLPKLTPA